MNKELKKLIKERQQIIIDNQNAKYYVLSRLTYSLDNKIKKLQSIEIRRLKTELWEKEQICKQNLIKVKKTKGD